MSNPASIADIRKFFEMDATSFRQDWVKLSDADKMDLKTGIGDGTLNY